MNLEIEESDLKSGLISLVVALAEIIKETLRLQAVKRMETGKLTDAEVERLGSALMGLDEAIERMKVDLGVTESVKGVLDGLDEAVENLVNGLVENQFTRA